MAARSTEDVVVAGGGKRAGVGRRKEREVCWGERREEIKWRENIDVDYLF